ncbi:LexA family protein [Epilithonimonas sp.]|uniref:LexA family protein n=1 Tax=Epilithonimonas sp. TaxID=2894511 RepID=UPI0035AE74C3
MKLIKVSTGFEDLEMLQIKQDGDKFYTRMVNSIANGFPSPAEDFAGEVLSLDERYLSKPNSTYIAKAKGMSNYPTILPGDIMIIRADLEPTDGDYAVVSFNNSKFSTKIIDKKNNKLKSKNPDFPEIIVGEGDVVQVMGKVFAIIREKLN